MCNDAFTANAFGALPAGVAGGVVPVAETPEEKKLREAAEDEKARAKLIKDAERKAAKDRPLAQTYEYLRRLPKDIGDSEDTLKAASQCTLSTLRQ